MELGFLKLMGKLQNDELCRSYCRQTDFYNHSAFQNVQGGHRLTQPNSYKKCLFRFSASERALSPKVSEEIFDHGFYPNPSVGIVGLEYHKFGGFLDRFFDEDVQPSDRDISPL